MQEEYSDISDLNYMGLTVPVDGAVAVIADGCRTWAPAPNIEPDARGEGERWVPMCYEAVTTADGKIIDVVAWFALEPQRWWLRCDRRIGHTIVLGAAELERVSWTDLPCLLVSTPAGWRFYNEKQMSAVCILSDLDKVDLSDLFGAFFGTIFCASQQLESRLQERAKACGEKLNTLVDDLL